MTWRWIDIPWWTLLYIPDKLRMINLFVFRVICFFLLTTWKHVTSSGKVYSISPMRTLTWEGIEFGNFILIASIHLWNQCIENFTSSSLLVCDFVTSLISCVARSFLWVFRKINARQIHVSIVPQLSKCLKFEALWGALTDQMIWIWTKRYNKTHDCIVVHRKARHNHLIDW